MKILAKKEFYINSILTFAVIVLADWLVDSGFKIFKGTPISQTVKGYKIPLQHLSIAFVISYYNLKKKTK